MICLRVLIPLLVLLSVYASAQEKISRRVAVERGAKTYIFYCDGTSSSPSIEVTLQDESGGMNILKKQLDDMDDCSQATWVVGKIGKNDSLTLVLLNPGRSGVNAQSNAFLVMNESVYAAGYLPVSAEKVGDIEYRSYSSEAGSIWERTDILQGGKFNVTNELRFVLSGSVCTNSAGEVLNQQPCSATLVVARHGKPICVGYKDHKGKVLPNLACSRLADQM